MFAKKVSVYAGLERRERPNCISEKCIKCAPKRNAPGSNPGKRAMIVKTHQKKPLRIQGFFLILWEDSSSLKAVLSLKKFAGVTV